MDLDAVDVAAKRRHRAGNRAPPGRRLKHVHAGLEVRDLDHPGDHVSWRREELKPAVDLNRLLPRGWPVRAPPGAGLGASAAGFGAVMVVVVPSCGHSTDRICS